MTECRNPEVQDLLPDFLSASLGDADRSRVVAHLAVCGACEADLVLLRQVREARPAPVAVNVSRIVSALPAPPVAQRPALQLHTSTPAPRPAVAARTPSRRWLQGTALLRVAAVAGVVVAGSMSVVIARRGITAVQESPSVALRADTLSVLAAAPSSTLAVVEPAEPDPARSTRSVPISYGDVGDYTEAELQAMLERLDKWDGASSTEPMPTLPMVAARGGSLE